MKYCLHYNVSKRYYDLVDEIKMPYRALEKIYNLFEKYPFSYIIEISPKIEELNWAKLKELNILTRQKITLCLNNIKFIEQAKQNGIKFYLNYEVSTFYDFNTLIAAGVEYVQIGAPLCFECEKLKQYKDKIRIVPNIAYTGDLPRNGVHGKWIRPEDVELYEDYISYIEFNEKTIDAEEALFRIYKMQQHWYGEMQMIIHNFGLIGINSYIPKEVAKRRINCGQRCESDGACHICDLATTLSLKKDIIRGAKEDNILK